MRRCAKPLINHYNSIRWSPNVPRNIKTILHDSTRIPLQSTESNALVSYYLGAQTNMPSIIERTYLIRYLYERHAFDNIVTLGNKLLYDNYGGNFREDVSFNELKRYLKSIMRTKDMDHLGVAMIQIIRQFSISRRISVINLINSIFVDLDEFTRSTNGIDTAEPLLKWTQWTKALIGHCDLTNYIQHKYLLKTLLFSLRQYKKNGEMYFKKCLKTINSVQGASDTSQFATTLMYLFAYDNNFPSVENVWRYKLENKFTISTSDLTCILKCYCNLKEYAKVQPTYDRFPEAHDDQSQFDSLLVAYSNSKNWQGLQDQFNALFGIGELPNIKHYGIVMYSMARIGELESVDMLFTQLLRRGMIPNHPVLQSLLLAYYKSGNLNACFTHFELFEKYSVEPSDATYTIMFKVFRNLNDIDGSLRLLKRMTENDRNTIAERHFAIPIHLCARSTNIPIAQELFNVMINYYDIIPSGISVSALMDVYIESDLPHEALKFFKKYGKETPVRNRLISVYNKAIKAYINMDDQINCESILNEVVLEKIPTDAEFYNVTLKYLVEMKKDFKTAEDTLDQLIQHRGSEVNAAHFETIMSAYDKISYREGVLNLYAKMIKEEIPVNSKILHLLIKSTFKVQMQTREDLQRAIDLLYKIMESSANRSLDVTYWRLHPSVMAWPVRAVAKLYSPMKAFELLNRYNELFYGMEDSPANNRFVVMRSLLILAAETEHWDDFDNIFERYVSRISQYEKLGDTTVRNKKLCTLFVGILSYKIRHLIATGNVIQLPSLIKNLKQRNFMIDNDSWNEAVHIMFADSRTIDSALSIVNEKLIHGYNLIHKHRLLTKFASTSTTSERQSWFLEKTKKDPKSFKPTLFLKSETYVQIMESMDQYLSSCNDLLEELKRLIENYPYFMKSYLREPRTAVPGWSQIEEEHASYMDKIRRYKRIVPVSEF